MLHSEARIQVVSQGLHKSGTQKSRYYRFLHVDKFSVIYLSEQVFTFLADDKTIKYMRKELRVWSVVQTSYARQ